MNTPFQLVYKVLRRNSNDTLCSARVSTTCPSASFTYEPHKWIYPHERSADAGYGIMAFSTLGQARHFLDTGSGTQEIWLAVGVPRSNSNNHCLAVSQLEDLLSKGQYESNYFSPFPEGTVQCSRLMLIAQLED